MYDMIPVESVDTTSVSTTRLFLTTRGQHVMFHYSPLSLLHVRIVQDFFIKFIKSALVYYLLKRNVFITCLSTPSSFLFFVFID